MHLSVKQRFRLSVAIFYFIQGIVFATWASRIPTIKESLGLSNAALGSVLLAIPVGQMAAMALSGYLVNRFGSRRMVMLAAFLYPAILIILGLAQNVFVLSAGLFLFGMAANLCNISVNTQGVDVESLYHGSIMATFHGLWSLGGFIGGLIGMGFSVAGQAPLTQFITIFVLALCLLVLSWKGLVKRDVKPHKPSQEGTETVQSKPKRFAFLTDPFILLLGVMAFGCMMCEGNMYDWSGVYFHQVVEAPENLTSLGYIVCMCTMTIGRFIADAIITRFGARTTIRFSGMFITVGLLLSVISPTIPVATFGFFIVGFGISSTVPICYSLAGHSQNMAPGTALAVVSTIGYLGFLIGPPFIGFMSQAVGLRWAFAAIACIGLLISILSSRLKSYVSSGSKSRES